MAGGRRQRRSLTEVANRFGDARSSTRVCVTRDDTAYVKSAGEVQRPTACTRAARSESPLCPPMRSMLSFRSRYCKQKLGPTVPIEFWLC